MKKHVSDHSLMSNIKYHLQQVQVKYLVSLPVLVSKSRLNAYQL